MIANYKEHGFVVTAERIPVSCTECPFWLLDMKTLKSGMCYITGTEIMLDGRQDEKRMDNCPVAKEADDIGDR